MKKYLVFTWQATGNCWMSNIKPFDTEERAVKYAEEKAGVVVYTDFYYDPNADELT